MATSRKRKRDLKDTSHTFLVPPDLAQSSSSAGPLAVVDKVSSDYRRTLPQTHRIRQPTPPLQPFFDDFEFDNDGLGDDSKDLGTTPIAIDHTKDSITERRKLNARTVSSVAFHLYWSYIHHIRGYRASRLEKI
jgi:hypothetical protein